MIGGIGLYIEQKIKQQRLVIHFQKIIGVRYYSEAVGKVFHYGFTKLKLENFCKQT